MFTDSNIHILLMYLKRNVITKLCKQLLINILNVDYLLLFSIHIEYKIIRE